MIFTYGAEIEAADWDTRVTLPEGSTVDMLDYTIANSNGLANDPRKQMNVFGGEVNLKPCDSIVEAVNEMMRVYSAMGNYAFNYTCNLHIHIGVAGLADDLEALKRLNDYIYNTDLDSLLPAIPKPDKSDKSAMGRFRQRKKSHRHTISETIYNERMVANTVEEFKATHGVYKNGGFAAFNAIRPGINMNALFKHGTIEFRCFPACDNPVQLSYIFRWCDNFINCALSGNEKRFSFKEEMFPEWMPFDPEMDKVFKATHYDKNSRKAIAKYYEENGYENIGSLPR